MHQLNENKNYLDKNAYSRFAHDFWAHCRLQRYLGIVLYRSSSKIVRVLKKHDWDLSEASSVLSGGETKAQRDVKEAYGRAGSHSILLI